MRVVIYEPNHRGHYLMYVALVADELARCGADVVLATSQTAHTSREFEQLIAPLADRIEVDPWMPAELPQGARGAWDRAGRIAASVRRARADHALVMHADRVCTGLLLRHAFGARPFPRGCEAEGLYFTSGLSAFRPDARQRIRDEVVWRIARRAPFARFHHLDPRAIDRLRREAPREATRWRLMPDPVEPPRRMTRQQARAHLGLPEGGRIIGCPGMIDRRKGCHLLLRAFDAAKRAPDDRLLLLGPQEPEIRELISREFSHLRSQGTLLEADRVFPPRDLGESLQAMDVVATPYPDHVASASIVIRAAAAQRPVLASRLGWLEYTVPRFGLGWLCDVRPPESLAQAITQALDAAPSWRPGPAAERFVAFHSPENFAACWSARVRERLGQAPQASIEWSSIKLDAEAADSREPALTNS